MSSAFVLSGRSFATRLDVRVEAVWQPLETVARVARSSAHLPPFHEGEFMFMGTASNAYKRLDVYLYKHVVVERLDRLADEQGTNRSELLRRGAAAVLEASELAAADRELQDAYRRIPQDPAVVTAATRLAARTVPEW